MHVARMRVRNRLAAAVMSVLVVWVTDHARAADRFVSTTGSDTANDCLVSTAPCSTVTHAVAQAASGDTVKVAGGQYFESLTVNFSTTLVFSGSWSADFSTRDLKTTPTMFGSIRADADSGEVVDVTVDGFTTVADVGSNAGGSVIGTIVNCRIPCGHPNRFNHFPGMDIEAYGSLNVSVNDTVVEQCDPGIKVFSGGSGSGTVVLSNVTLRKNGGFGSTGLRVASLDSSTLSLVVNDSVITRNRVRGHYFGNIPAGGAVGGGGAQVLADDSSSLSVDVTDSIFSRNSAGQGAGGGLTAFGGGGSLSVTFTNSAVTGNRAVDGGGIFMSVYGAPPNSTSLTLTNVTITGNRAKRGGGGMSLWSGTTNLTNTILWGNSTAAAADLRMDQFGGDMPVVNADHSDIGSRATVAGTFNDLGGNMSADPELRRAVDGWLLLMPSSPAIDTGTCTGAPTTDFEGDPRPTGAGCDMGADEFVP